MQLQGTLLAIFYRGIRRNIAEHLCVSLAVSQRVQTVLPSAPFVGRMPASGAASA